MAPLAFGKFSWDFMRSEVMGFFREFYELGSFKRSLNATCIVLVPKKGSTNNGGLYNLPANILTNRLKKAVGKSGLIFPAFICGG